MQMFEQAFRCVCMCVCVCILCQISTTDVKVKEKPSVASNIQKHVTVSSITNL